PSQIKLNKNNKTVQFAPRQRIDLGSIGKGYAIDLAYDVLEDFPAFMINAGGDIRIKGPKPDGENWKIGLYKSQLPNQALPKDAYTGIIELENGSVCGSGGWARKVRFFHHLINPKTGFPINEITQTYVIAPKAIEADSWATVLFTMGERGLPLLKEQGFKGILIDQKGKLLQTESVIQIP
ncbi:MAG TPA: FAD:protein FMN transferase, partial [Candidatus Dojkabacteria bacterium]|nr:FAD:protein FMN transferase [Candidatus Dojkabacteria bacterium]